MKNILIIGSGGREHALGWKLSQSPHVGKICFAPGNAGTAQLGTNIPIAVEDVEALCLFAKMNQIDLTIVGPEAALEKGVVNLFHKEGLAIFGPSKEAARLETSKAWTSEFLKKHNLPHPTSFVFSDFQSAITFFTGVNPQEYVIKVDGLCLGKGVFLPESLIEAKDILTMIMIQKNFGEAGNKIVVQQRISGYEVSLLAFSDGKYIRPMIPAQDYKRLLENNTGPMTGGVGAIAPSPEHIDELVAEVLKRVFIPTIKGMKFQSTPYVGVLYAGLMITADGPKVLEFNARFGDPETQVLMVLLESDLYDIINACVTGTLSETEVQFSNAYAQTVILTAKGYPGNYQKFVPIQGAETNAVQVFHAGTTMKNGQVVTSGGRVLAVTAKGSTKAEVRDKVYKAIGKQGIYFEGMQFRRDIGEVARDDIYRIEILSSPDMRSVVRQKKFGKQVFIEDVYTIHQPKSSAQVTKLAELLVNPVIQTYRISSPKQPLVNERSFTWAIEIGYLPGVTDNVATTTKEMMIDIGEVFTSQVTYITEACSYEEVQQLANSLYNPLIQRAVIRSYDEYLHHKGMGFSLPEVTITDQPSVTTVDLHGDDQELTTLGSQGIKNADGSRRGPLALDLLYLKTIRNYFDSLGRNPTDVELESIAQTWSEHCKHTIFKDPLDEISEGIYERYIKQTTAKIRQLRKDKDICISVFADNSGAIIFDEHYLITDKVETHNSPSALDPFGGAVTGIVGVNRDTLGFGLGAKPILNRYGFCLADPKLDIPLYRDQTRTQQLLSSARMLDGVVAGVNSGGNCSGIPTPLGFLYFDERFRGKPLVFAGTVGLLPRQSHGRLLWQKSAQPGDYIVMLGGRVGLDGIHGATFSSEALTSGSPATAVQIGDPITQKKLSDALIKEARDRGLYRSITDNGAGGLSCSVAEMAKEAGGCEVQLDQVPVKYPGLQPWQIWISESQERMTLAVPPEHWQDFLTLMNKRGVEATRIGTFTNSGVCQVSYEGAIVMRVDMEFLHNGLPQRVMKSSWKTPVFPEPRFIKPQDYTEIFKALLSRLNIGSIETISSQYDHEVQATSVLKPLQGKGRVNGEATVIQPLANSAKGVVVSYGLYPSYSNLDPYHMAAASIDTAIRNAVVVGGNIDHLALLDNFCWCNPRDPQRLGQLKLAAQALADYALAYETPIISGKDSMYNDFKGFDAAGNSLHISIPPTLLISSVGVVQHVAKVVSLDAKQEQDEVYLLGETHNESGGSEYYDYLGVKSHHVPRVQADKNKQLYMVYSAAVEKGLIVSAISVGRGGLSIALGKMALAGNLGLDLSLNNLPGTATEADQLLFSESQGRIVVTIRPQDKKVFAEIFKDIPFAYLGTVQKERAIHIEYQGQPIVTLKLKDALSAYKSTFGIIHQIKPSVAVLTGYGINCEEETGIAFEKAGATYQIIHINDLINHDVSLAHFEMLAVPGGFSFGDDTGSGNAFALKMKQYLWEDILQFISDDRLVIGICNGFQILVNLGLLPALDQHYGARDVALIHNDSAIYADRWVDIAFESHSPWTRGVRELSLPIAHGEGKFFASERVLEKLRQKRLIAGLYTNGDICRFQSLPSNPNGSLDNIAAITDETGRIFGLMPHPERAIAFTHLPHWTYLKEQYQRQGKPLPTEGPGLKIFRNAVNYFE